MSSPRRQTPQITGRKTYQHSSTNMTRSRYELHKRSTKEAKQQIVLENSSSDDEKSDYDDADNSTNVFQNASSSTARSRSRSAYRSPTRPPTSMKIRERLSTFESDKPSESSSLALYILLAISVVLIGISAVFAVGSLNTTTEKKVCLFENLKNNYSKQDPYLWRALKAGIEGVLNNQSPKPSVFLFLHQNDSSTRRIVSDIVTTAAHCFDPKLQAVTFDSKDFRTEDVSRDHGVVIERYKEALHSGGVLFIADLNNIPSNAARSLHFICDNENPIVRNVVIFLTLRSSSYAGTGKSVQIAEDTLNSIWGSAIDQNNLSALIARLTDQVLSLKPE